MTVKSIVFHFEFQSSRFPGTESQPTVASYSMQSFLRSNTSTAALPALCTIESAAGLLFTGPSTAESQHFCLGAPYYPHVSDYGGATKRLLALPGDQYHHHYQQQQQHMTAPVDGDSTNQYNTCDSSPIGPGNFDTVLLWKENQQLRCLLYEASKKLQYINLVCLLVGGYVAFLHTDPTLSMCAGVMLLNCRKQSWVCKCSG